MPTKIVFENNFGKVKAALSNEVIAAFHEIGNEIKSQVQRNTRVDSGETKRSFNYAVDTDADEIMLSVGSDYENAIWEEYGTGEYAVNGDGRKGGWYIPEEKLSPKAKSMMKKVIGKGGKVFYYTKGKKPTKALTKSFEKKKKWAQNRLNEKLGEISDGT